MADPAVIREWLTRAAGDQQGDEPGVDYADPEAVEPIVALALFLNDPTSRCPFCLADDHQSITDCDHLDDDDLERIYPGMSTPEALAQLDAVYASLARRMAGR